MPEIERERPLKPIVSLHSLNVPHPCPARSACRAVWYCGTDCSHADWRAGHRRVCKALGAARATEKERRRQAAAEAAAGKEQQE